MAAHQGKARTPAPRRRLLSRLRHPAIVTFRDFVSLSALTHVDPFVTVESLAHKVLF